MVWIIVITALALGALVYWAVRSEPPESPRPSAPPEEKPVERPGAPARMDEDREKAWEEYMRLRGRSRPPR